MKRCFDRNQNGAATMPDFCERPKGHGGDHARLLPSFAVTWPNNGPGGGV